LTLAPSQSFEPEAYYTWFYDGSSVGTIIGAVAMVVIMLAAVMFPLWPASLRLGVWYLSVGVLCLIGAFIGLAILRLIGWAITSLVMKHGIWLFPNLFEDVGFVSSIAGAQD
jgi:translocation protein SEC62